MDDESTLVNIGKMSLEKLEYTVEARADSLEALNLFRDDPDKFDLVITDMTKPHLTGENLTRKLKEIRSDVPVIICTGFNRNIYDVKYQKT